MSSGRATESSSLLRSHRNQIQNSQSYALEIDENPRHWDKKYRWLCVSIVSLYGLISPVMASAIVPALPDISHDLGIIDDRVTRAVVSTYLLSWYLAPVILGPLSELYGRVVLLNLGQGIFMLMNILCALCQTSSQLIVIRLLSGLAAAGPLAIGPGIISDLWPAEERGLALSLYALGPLLGPAVGPIAGSYISLASGFSWRWIFLWSSFSTLITLVLGICVLRETSGPILVQRKKDRILSRRGGCNVPSLSTQFDDNREGESSASRLRNSLSRPFILLFTQPILQILAVFGAYQFGLTYLTIATFQALWRDVYNQSSIRASLNYVSIALGFLSGSISAGLLNDKIYRLYKAQNGGKETPDTRIFIMLPSALLVPIGLLCYGWSAELKLHWIVPNIGVFIYAFGLIISYQCVQAYLIDCYSQFAASAMGSFTIARSISVFVFPILAPMLFKALGYGLGSTVLAGVATCLGLGIPVILKTYGPWLRARSSYIIREQ